ncbi:MAG TPA: ABC transporter permease [Actinomycetota bacterium]|nr:ABC transporter permease [Actinomycetota bacterium]
MESRRRAPFATVITVAALLFLFVPLGVVVLFSFNAGGSLTFPFAGFSMRWYREIMESPAFRDAVANSAIVASVVAIVTLLFGTLAAYGLTRATSRFRAPIAVLLFLPLTLPGLFLGLSLLVMFARLERDLSLRTVAIAHMVYVLPYYLLISVAALQRLDPALEEAGADLGANGWLVFRRVTLPQVWPVLVAAACLAFALSFDEFIITFFVIGPESTLPLFIFSTLRRTVDPSVNAISSLLLAITLVLFAVAFVLTVRAAKTAGLAIDAETLGGTAR